MTGKIKVRDKEELKSQILYWLCAGFVYSMLFWTYLNSVLAILISAYWLFFLKKEFSFTSQKSRIVLLFISIYLISLIGLTYTSNMSHGLAVLKKQSALLFFPLVFGTTTVLSPQVVKKICIHFLIATEIACVTGLCIGLFKFASTDNIEAITGKGLLVFHAFNPVIMGLYCLTSLVFIFIYDLGISLKIKKWLWVLPVILSIFIFLLSIRIIIACWLLLILFFLWKKMKIRKYKIALTLAILLLIIISGMLISPLKRQWIELADFSQKNSVALDKDSSLGRGWGGKAIRIAIWKCGTDIIKKHWLAGVGTGDTQDSLQQAYENRKFYFASRYNQYNAHNQYLQSAIGSGIPGLLLLILCILIPLYQYRLKYANNIYQLFLLLFAITAFTESILEVNKGIIWYSFLNSIFAFASIKKTASNK